MGKSCRLPFLSVEHEIKTPFHKIHCDLWGPVPIRSQEQFRFYAIFIDDSTHFTWFYPMCKKSNLTNYFDHFHKYISCHFNANIHIFHSDKGGEFASGEFSRKLATLGIHHQFACPKTLEQNGIAKREHQNIIELGLTMMFHAHLPPRFWIECFSTVVYLINRLPSPTLGMDSPFSKLMENNLTIHHFVC